jgi:hypothetical protein
VIEDAVWRAGCSPRSAPASGRVAVERTALAPDLVPSALLALRGWSPSVVPRAAHRICATLVLARRSPCPRPYWNSALKRMQLPRGFRPEAVRQPAAVPRASYRQPVWLALYRLPRAPVVEAAAALVPISPESPHAISHRCISHWCGRRSGFAPASPARLESVPGWAVAAPSRGSDNRRPPRPRDF